MENVKDKTFLDGSSWILVIVMCTSSNIMRFLNIMIGPPHAISKHCKNGGSVLVMFTQHILPRVKGTTCIYSSITYQEPQVMQTFMHLQMVKCLQHSKVLLWNWVSLILMRNGMNVCMRKQHPSCWSSCTLCHYIDFWWTYKTSWVMAERKHGRRYFKGGTNSEGWITTPTALNGKYYSQCG